MRVVDPASAAIAAGAATAVGDGAIVFHPPAGASPPHADAPAVQRAEGDTSPTTAPTADSADAAAPAEGAAEQSPQELEELARKLYERIRARLKSELRWEREASGLHLDRRI